MKKLLDIKIPEPETIKEDNSEEDNSEEDNSEEDSFGSKYIQVSNLPYVDRLDAQEIDIETLKEQMFLVRNILKSDRDACVQCQSLKRAGIVLFAFSGILNAFMLYQSF